MYYIEFLLSLVCYVINPRFNWFNYKTKILFNFKWKINVSCKKIEKLCSSFIK